MKLPWRKEPDPFAASRYSDVIKGVRVRERKHMRHKWQWILLSIFVIVGLIGGTGAYIYFHTQGKGQIKNFDPNDITRTDDNSKPFNALLVGSDSRTGLTEEEQLKLGANSVGGQRSDTIILAHVDPSTDHVTMVQFPRDLYVPIASGGTDKINSAYEDGRSNLVQTIKDLTGLPINHYVEVNLAGFRDIVDAVGGVDVCVTSTFPFDTHVGLGIEKAGLIHFDADSALRFVRSREVFATGDFERIQNQQRFLSAALHKVTSVSTFFNWGRLKGMLDVAGKNLRYDEDTTLKGVYDLLKQFKAFNPNDYEAYTAPNFGSTTIELPGGIPSSIVKPDFEAMKVMFEAIANNESPAEADGVPDIAPSSIRVGVYNGTFRHGAYTEGAAGAAAEALKQATDVGSGPVRVTEVADGDKKKRANTEVVYDASKPETKVEATLVAAAIPGASIVEGHTRPGVDVAVMVGPHFKAKRIVQILPLAVPNAGSPPPVCQEEGKLILDDSSS
jgi:LCP family protein required for cell wall assembly